MAEKYVVPKEVMNAINNWKDKLGPVVEDFYTSMQSDTFLSWWLEKADGNEEINNRLTALIRYVNGEEMFEVAKPKYVVGTVYRDENDQPLFLELKDQYGYPANADNYAYPEFGYNIDDAFPFATYGDALKFSSPILEIFEVED